MPKIAFEFDSDEAPEKIVKAATDFSERRTELWPNLDFFEVHRQDRDFAEVTEGTNFVGRNWSRELYSWPEEGVVRLVTQDSNMFKPGSTWEMRVTPGEEGGSHIAVVNHRRTKGVRGRLIGVAMSAGRSRFKSDFKKMIERAASEQR